MRSGKGKERQEKCERTVEKNNEKGIYQEKRMEKQIKRANTEKSVKGKDDSGNVGK